MQLHVQVIEAFCKYIHNASFREFRETFIHHSDAWCAKMWREKMDSPTRFWGKLDATNQLILTRVAIARWELNEPADMRALIGLTYDEQMERLGWRDENSHDAQG
jgi:hypothetical protein